MAATSIYSTGMPLSSLICCNMRTSSLNMCALLSLQLGTYHMSTSQQDMGGDGDEQEEEWVDG